MHLIDQHDVFKNLEQIFQKVGRFFTTRISSLNVRRTRPCFLHDPNHLVLNSSCLLYKCQTFLSLSQSSLISVATQQVAGVKSHRQLNDFTLSGWGLLSISQRLVSRKSCPETGSLYSCCYWPARGPWTSYATSLSLSFCHLSPTYYKYLLAPREVFDLLRENYIK